MNAKCNRYLLNCKKIDLGAMKYLKEYKYDNRRIKKQN